MASCLQVENLTKSYGEQVLFENISFTIEEGRRVALVAKNGTGKTTLLNIIAGMLEPDEGSVVRARQLEIGYLRQNDALDGDNTLQQEAQNAFARVYARRSASDGSASVRTSCTMLPRPTQRTISVHLGGLAVGRA